MNTERHDDAGLDRLYRAALEPAMPAQDDVCPDADTIAAYAEGGLTVTERTALEPHLASCASCQSVLAMVAADSLTEAAAAQAAGPARLRSWRAWFAVPHVRWLLPAAGTAIAVTTYIAVGRTPSSTPAPTVVSSPSGQAAAPTFTLAERAEPQAPVLQPSPVTSKATDPRRTLPSASPAAAPQARVGLGPAGSAATRQPAGFVPATPVPSTPLDQSAGAPAATRAAAAAPALAEAVAVERSRAADLAAREAVDVAPPPAPKGTPAANAANAATAVADRRSVTVWPEAPPERGKRVRLYPPSLGTGSMWRTNWPFSDLVVQARVSAVGRARLAPVESGGWAGERLNALVPMMPIEFEIVEVLKRRDGVSPAANITVWHQGGEVEDSSTIHRVPVGQWVQAAEGDEFVLFLRGRRDESDSRAFEPYGFADGFYRLDGDQVFHGVSLTPDPSLTRNGLLARLRQLAGTAAR